MKPPKFEHIFVAFITFSPFFCADIFNVNLLLIVCALREYVKYLYRHVFLEDTSKKARVTKKMHPPNFFKYNSQVSCLEMPKFGLWLAKTLSCDKTEKIIFYLKHCQVMVIRRRDITDIAWVFARLKMKCLISNERETALIICLRFITAKCFGKPQTKFGHL